MKKFFVFIMMALLATAAFAAGDGETAAPLLAFLKAHWAELLAGLMAFAKVVVRLTPSAKDDAIFGKIDKVIEWLVPNITKSGTAK